MEDQSAALEPPMVALPAFGLKEAALSAPSYYEGAVRVSRFQPTFLLKIPLNAKSAETDDKLKLN